MDGKKVKLRLEHISQSYIVKNEVSDAVVDVSLDVYDNEFLVILGPGRCGKTVLLNMIAGLEKPVDGSLFLDGEEIHGSDERIFVTNNIEEALYLADRIVLLTNYPAQVKEIYDINLPRPRDTVSPEFLRLRKIISDNTDLAL